MKIGMLTAVLDHMEGLGSQKWAFRDANLRVLA